MTHTARSMLILAAVIAAGIGGYRIGRHDHDISLARARATQAPSGPVIYYQDPDGKPFYSAEPKSTADGRPYRAIHASEDISFDDEAKGQPQNAGRGPRGRPPSDTRH